MTKLPSSEPPDLTRWESAIARKLRQSAEFQYEAWRVASLRAGTAGANSRAYPDSIALANLHADLSKLADREWAKYQAIAELAADVQRADDYLFTTNNNA